MSKHKIPYYFSMFIIGLLFLTLLVLGYWKFYPYKILVFGENNGNVITKQVKAGTYLQFVQHYCKTGDYVSEVNRQFIDSIIYQVPTSAQKRREGCHENIEYLYVPKALSPATYHIETVITYRPNPVREIIYTIESEQFEVIE